MSSGLFTDKIEIGRLRSLADRGDEFAELVVSIYDYLKMGETMTPTKMVVTPLVLAACHGATVDDDTDFGGLAGYDTLDPAEGHTLTEHGTPQESVIDVDEIVFITPGGGSNLPARVLASIPLPACTPSGSGIGKTLTADFGGALTVDGVLLDQDDVVLVNRQANKVDNGLYTLTTQGGGEDPWILTRSNEMDEPGDTGLNPDSATVSIAEGNTWAGTSWVLDGVFIFGGPLTVDGRVLSVGERFLYKGRNTGSTAAQRNHGIYDVIQIGDAETPWVLRRSSDFNEDSEAISGSVVHVLSGDENADTYWISKAPNLAHHLDGLRVILFYAYDPSNPTTLDPHDSKISGNLAVSGDLTAATLNGQPVGGGGAQIIGGMLNFDTEGSGDPQTYSGNLLYTVKPTGATYGDGAGRGGLLLPAGEIKNLRVRCLNIDGGENTNVSWHARVYKNDNLTALVVDGANSSLQSNIAGVITVSEGDYVQIFFTTTLTDGPSNPQTDIRCAVSMEFSPAPPA